MKRSAHIIALSLMLGTCASAAPKWARILSGTAVCAGSALGLATTKVGIDRGLVETNGRISENGRPQWGRMFVMNGAMCAGAMTLALSERVPSALVYATNVPLAGIRLSHGVRNIRTIQRQEPGQVR